MIKCVMFNYNDCDLSFVLISRIAYLSERDFRYLSYEERLEECGLTTLEMHRLKWDQIEVFKILNCHGNIDPNMFFKIKTFKRTRRHDFKLEKGQSWLYVRQYSFSQRTVNDWNKLSADCVILVS